MRVKIDEREGLTPGFKFNDWEMRGVPIRIEIGPRDVAAGEVVLARRDRLGPEAKQKAPLAEVPSRVTSLLAEIQQSLFDQALGSRSANTREFDNYAAFAEQMEGEGGGGMAQVLLVRQSRMRNENPRRDQGDLPRDSAQSERRGRQMHRMRRARDRARFFR